MKFKLSDSISEVGGPRDETITILKTKIPVAGAEVIRLTEEIAGIC